MVGRAGCVVAAASGNRTGALYVASPFAPHPPSAPSPRMRGEGNICREEGNICAERIFCERKNENGPLRGRSVSRRAVYFVGAAAGAAVAFLAKSPARNTLSASGLRCVRIAAFTWSTVSAAYFASRSAVNCMVRP